MAHDYNYLLQQTRRTFLGNSSRGVGTMALASLLHSTVSAQEKVEVPRWNGVVEQLHFPAKAKRVIYLFQSGAPSQMDLFDYKPNIQISIADCIMDKTMVTFPGLE